MNTDFNLYDAVKWVESKTISYSEKEGESSERLESTSILLFDESKNLLEITYSNLNSPLTRTINRFDLNNRKIETQYFQAEILQSKSEFFYDSTGREVERRFYDFQKNQESVSKSIYIKDGFRVEKSDYSELFKYSHSACNFVTSLPQNIAVDFFGSDVQTSKEIYNVKNNLIERRFYNSKGKIIGRVFVDYNANNQPTEVTTFGSDSTFLPENVKKWQKFLFLILHIVTYSFFSLLAFVRLFLKGKFRKGVRFLIYKSPFSEKKVLYDSKGRKIEEKCFLFLKEESRILFKYDDKNNKIEELNDFYKETNEYEYDSRNNWIKKITRHHFSTQEMAQMMNRIVVTYRKIKYFDKRNSPFC